MSPANPIWKRLCLGVWLGLLALGVSGCSRSARVSGTVKYQGRPLTSGYVVFVDSTNHSAPPASIQADGTYLVPEVRIGPATILVDQLPPRPPETASPDSLEYKEYETKLEAFVPLPRRYANLQESGKTFEVKSGSNVCNIELD